MSLGVSVSVSGCLSRLSLCDPVMDWRPVQGEPRLSPNHRWERLQPPRDPTDGLSGYRKWMEMVWIFLQQIVTEASPGQQQTSQDASVHQSPDHLHTDCILYRLICC